MKSVKKKGLGILASITMVLSLFAMLININAEEGKVVVSNKEDFVAAINDKKAATIELSASMDITGVGVLDVDGLTIDLGGNKLSADNFSAIFQGDNFKIANGQVDSKGGAYALFIGDERTTENVVIENIVATGGINVYNAKDVKLINVIATGTLYYALWSDENAFVIIESGTFQTNGVAVLGTANVSADVNSTITVNDGVFHTNGKPLVLEDGSERGEVNILGGKYDCDPTKYLIEGYQPYIVDGQLIVAPKTTEITLEQSARIELGSTLTLNAILKPAETLDAVIWTSDNEEVATVENGVVTAKGVGTATITVKAGDQSATCVVTVYEAEEPTEPTTPSHPQAPSEQDKPADTNKPAETETPNTSDNSMIVMYDLMAILSGAILIVLKKKESLNK